MLMFWRRSARRKYRQVLEALKASNQALLLANAVVKATTAKRKDDNDKAIESLAFRRILAVIHGTDSLSEGQIVSITGLDRVRIRELIDTGRIDIEVSPLEGENGAAIMREMGLPHEH